MRDFRELRVWQNAHQLTLDVYGLTVSFPKSELYGLTSQLRRAASSIPTNIAEGSARGSSKDFGRFLQIALGSATETEYLLLLSKDLNFITIEDYNIANQQTVEIKRMLVAFIKQLRTQSN